jgi:extracellular factor (EF) 3-hydroxypalmitic acid methyl ester biosynthesis protein
LAGAELLGAANLPHGRRKDPHRRDLRPANPESLRYGGVLKGNFGEIAVELIYASPFSLYANPLGRVFLPFNTSFDSLTVQTENGELKFGRCSFIPPGEFKDARGLLVFENDIYNFEHLFRDEALFNFEKSFQNLPLALTQKAAVSPLFKEFTAELTYELNVYKTFFDELDAQLAKERPAVREAARMAIINGEGRKFMTHFSEWLGHLENVTAGFTRDEHERHGFYFRKQLWHIIATSRFLTRTNLKPRGYAGDSEMMRMIYSDGYEGDSIFGQLLHKHPIESAAAQAVRNRRMTVPSILREVKRRLQPSGNFKIMSVACGPASEMQDLFRESDDFTQFDLTLLDQDVEALGEASNAISNVERMRNAKARVTYLNESVRTMLRTPSLPEIWGRFHYIYSMGLFDYLNVPVAKSVARKLFDLLLPGGELLIGNYHVKNPTRTYMEYWMDWVLLYRTEADMCGILDDIPGADCRLSFEATGSQMFLRVRRTV